MKLYNLVRHEDVSGTSGVGVVGEIVEFSDDRCVMRWVAKDKHGLPLPSSVVIYDNMKELQLIHCHNGASQVVRCLP